jgi:hypothetical protein
MPLFQHSGLDTIDFTPGTIRTEMSDALLASLYLRPNLLAALPIASFGGGGAGVGAANQILVHFWLEDRLNPRKVTELTGGGMTAIQTTMTVSAADGSVMDIGYYVSDTAQASSAAEFIQITGIAVGTPNYTLTVTRGQLGTTGVTHAASAIFQVIATPVPQNSDLGRDMSRAPGIKNNLIQTWRRDINISSAMLSMAQHGLVPGIPNQLAYQLHQRFSETLIDMENTAIQSISTGTSTTTDYQTMWGVLSWLGMMATNANTTATPQDALTAPLSDLLFNTVAINIYNQGAEIPDAIVAAPFTIDRIARIYRDQMRLSQDELIRGYFVDAIRVSIGVKPVRLIMTGYMPYSTSTAAVNTAAFLSLDRLAIIPFLDQFCYLLSAPSFRDGDALSVLSKWTLEVRNTGTDFGFAHQALKNFSL